MKLYKNKEWLMENLLTKTQKEMANIAGCHVGTIEEYISRHSLKGYRDKVLMRANTDKMTLDNPAFCYLLGLFVTDGYFTKGDGTKNGRVEITQRRGEVLYNLQEELGGRIYHTHVSGDVKYILMLTHVSDVFKSFGYSRGAKTFTVDAPEGIKGSQHERLFIRGMVDGDGTVSPNGKVRFFSVSKPLISCYEDYLTRTGVEFGSYPHANGISVEVKGGYFVEPRLGIHLYEGYPELAIPYKLNRVNKVIDDIVRTYEMVNHKK